MARVYSGLKRSYPVRPQSSYLLSGSFARRDRAVDSGPVFGPKYVKQQFTRDILLKILAHSSLRIQIREVRGVDQGEAAWNLLDSFGLN